MDPTSLHRTIWRWHFYAGLFVMPFVLLLSLTGAIYLFKPQIDRWEERAFQALPVAGAVSPGVQLDAALAAFPGARLDSYRLPERPGDAPMLHLALADRQTMRDVFVSPQGRVLGSLDPERRIPVVIAKIHGSLLIGPIGDKLVELAASWAIVMILSGLYLWWPRGGALAGVVWPRLGRGKQAMWRDLHAVTGFWVAGLALVMLASGLPWAGTWGGAFKAVRAEFGLMKGPQDWKVGAARPEHAAHDHAEMMMAGHAPPSVMALLPQLVRRAEAERLAFPALVKPPGAAERGGKTSQLWTIKSEAQNRTLGRSISFDPATGAEVSRTSFGDRHIIDRIVNIGIAWHEGALFGWINQLVGVLTAVALIMLTVSGFVQWRRRRPEGELGAPRPAAMPARIGGVATILFVLAALLPLLALSLVALWLFDRLVLPRAPKLGGWLGAPARPG